MKLVVNYVVLSQENMDEIKKQITKAIIELANKMSVK